MGKKNVSNFGWGPDGYTIKKSWTDQSGNHHCERVGSSGQTGSHYTNRDGKWGYNNPDSSTYKNNGKGEGTFTFPNQYSHTKKAN